MERREFLKRTGKVAAALGAAPILPRLIAAPAFAAATGSYKAIVCLFLAGGNDGNNMLVPADAHYDEYAAGRGSLTLNRNVLNTLIPTSSGRIFGAHPSLKKVASLYNNRQAAWLANAGPLTKPITKSSFGQSGQTPLNLFSHESQQAEWQSAVTQSQSTSGWAGRIADLLSAKNQSLSMPSVISTTGWSLLGQGTNTTAAATGAGGNTTSVMNALQGLNSTIARIESSSTVNHLQSQISGMQSGFLDTTKQLLDVYAAGASLQTVFPNNFIGQQLQAVAKMINGRSASGASRQIFTCTDIGYDTHAQQLAIQATNLNGLDAAIGAFASAMKEIGMFDQVTLFTMTDFARSHVSNSTGGSDHAWGNHHLLVGGAIKGGDVYGTFPSLSLGGDDDAGTTGLWIPTTSGTQYAATLARWLDVSASDTNQIFPELGNFSKGTIPLFN